MPEFQRRPPPPSFDMSPKVGWALGLVVLAFVVFIFVGVSNANDERDCDRATMTYIQDGRQDLADGRHPSDWERELRHRALEEACE